MKCKFLSIVAVFILLCFTAQIAFAQQTISPEMTTATELIKQYKWQEAEKAFAEIVKKEPKNARAWFLLGFAKHSQEKWESAIEAFKKNVEIAQVPAGMYNIAAGYSRLNRKDEAFEWLEKALNNGAAFTTNLSADADFENIKTDARFKKMLDIAERKSKPCMYSEEARQFDFWIGDWEVFVGGKKVGESLVELELTGCTLVENWKSQSGNLGKSLNSYDTSDKKWKQFYVGNDGNVLELVGDYKDNLMSLKADTIGANGVKTMNILDFYNLPDKTVRQHWQQSTDGGKTWITVWDSIYVKKKTEKK
jgi:tetratricopeptide (TPR) repeat protein